MAGDANNVLVGAATFKIDGTDIGYTKGGTTVRHEMNVVRVMADQAVGVVAVRRSEEFMFVTTQMLEVTLARLREAFNQPSANLSGSTLTLGYNNSCTVNEHEIVLIGVGPNCDARTITLTRCVAYGTKEYNMQRDEETAFEVEFECLKDSNGNFGTIVDV